MSDFSCVCDGMDEVKVSSSRWVKSARKPHVCSECSRPIEIGQPYEYTFQAYHDGYTSIQKMCADCKSLLDWVYAHVPCFCWYSNYLHSCAADTVAEFAFDEKVDGMWFEFARKLFAINGPRRVKGRELWALGRP